MKFKTWAIGGCLTLVSALILIGCSNSASPLSCDFSTSASYCKDYSPGSSVSCPSPGVVSTSVCPTANRVGSCANSIATTRYYSTGGNPYTTATAQSNCSGTGTTFTAN